MRPVQPSPLALDDALGDARSPCPPCPSQTGVRREGAARDDDNQEALSIVDDSARDAVGTTGVSNTTTNGGGGGQPHQSGDVVYRKVAFPFGGAVVACHQRRDAYYDNNNNCGDTGPWSRGTTRVVVEGPARGQQQHPTAVVVEPPLYHRGARREPPEEHRYSHHSQREYNIRDATREEFQPLTSCNAARRPALDPAPRGRPHATNTTGTSHATRAKRFRRATKAKAASSGGKSGRRASANKAPGARVPLLWKPRGRDPDLAIGKIVCHSSDPSTRGRVVGYAHKAWTVLYDGGETRNHYARFLVVVGDDTDEPAATSPSHVATSYYYPAATPPMPHWPPLLPPEEEEEDEEEEDARARAERLSYVVDEARRPNDERRFFDESKFEDNRPPAGIADAPLPNCDDADDGEPPLLAASEEPWRRHRRRDHKRPRTRALPAAIMGEEEEEEEDDDDDDDARLRQRARDDRAPRATTTFRDETERMHAHDRGALDAPLSSEEEPPNAVPCLSETLDIVTATVLTSFAARILEDEQGRNDSAFFSIPRMHALRSIAIQETGQIAGPSLSVLM